MYQFTTREPAAAFSVSPLYLSRCQAHRALHCSGRAQHRVSEHERNERIQGAGGCSVQDLQAHRPNFVIGDRGQYGANRPRPKSNQQRDLRPQLFAFHPTNKAVGIVTTWAVMMQAQMNALSAPG